MLNQLTTSVENTGFLAEEEQKRNRVMSILDDKQYLKPEYYALESQSEKNEDAESDRIVWYDKIADQIDSSIKSINEAIK